VYDGRLTLPLALQATSHTDPDEFYVKQEKIGKGSFGEVFKGCVALSFPLAHLPWRMSARTTLPWRRAG
jgi:hypothetical protein